jgi:hypothetical protein
MAAGVVFIVAPSGTGVREIIIVAALAPVMPSAEAFGIALVSRMLFIVADGVSAGVAAVSGRRHLRREPQTNTAASSAASVGDHADWQRSAVTGSQDAVLTAFSQRDGSSII